jgi:NADH dehydrogenase (ubiquinone) Fe-S protein 4
MSLTSVCQKSLSKYATVKHLVVPLRGLADSARTSNETKDIVSPLQDSPKDVVVADVISGAPGERNGVLHQISADCVLVELRHRAVRIFQPTRNTMQCGGKPERWRIDWDILQGGGRWENPLMGWASS